jgi:hypothetical protein
VLTTHLEPIRDYMAALSGTTTTSPRTKDAALQAAGRQHCDRLQGIDAEQEKICNSTWTHPEVELAEQNITIQLPTDYETTDAGSAGQGFDTKKLPNYGFGNNLAEWNKRMDIIIMTYGQTKVCPSVVMHSLAEGDVVRTWFVLLGNTDIEYTIMRTGSWEFMKSKFTEKWQASVVQLQLACDKRKKKYNELYSQYAL